MNYLISIQKEDPNTTYEWYEYHKKFSFDKIVVFNNSTNKLTIDYIDVSKMKAPQPMCYQWFYDNVAEYGDTITVLDADEFLTSDKTIQDIWADFDLTVDCIRFSWQIFGDNGLDKDDGRPVLERFTKQAPIDAVYNHKLPKGITENWHTKYSVRKNGPARLLIHNAITNGKTMNMNHEQINPNSPWIPPTWKTAFVRHFITKDMETFCKRRLGKLDACGNKINDDDIRQFYYNLNGRFPNAKEKC